MNLFFVRHGESEANILRVFSNRNAEHGLTDKGRDQVERLAENIKGTVFDAMYASPLLRARETAEIISGKLNIGYEVAQELTEFDVGVLEGKSDDESWNRYEALLHEWLVELNGDVRIEDGESCNDVRNRVIPFINGLLGKHPGESNILLIGHGGTYRCVFPIFLPSSEIQLNNTEYVSVRMVQPI